MIFLDVNMPENMFECPFLEEDCETNELYCYFKPAIGESGYCVGLCAKGCLIISSVKEGFSKQWEGN